VASKSCPDIGAFKQETHVKLRPVGFPTNGIFLGGLAHFEETIAQAQATAARAGALLSQDSIVTEGAIITNKVLLTYGFCSVMLLESWSKFSKSSGISFIPSSPKPSAGQGRGQGEGDAILKLLTSYAFGQLSIFDWLFLNLWALRPSARMVGALYFKV